MAINIFVSIHTFNTSPVTSQVKAEMKVNERLNKKC